jgi:hypothetical protein
MPASVGCSVWLDLSEANIFCELAEELTNTKACAK